ncbi:BCD family MFS transporter [Oceanibaculum indicum]|uniref:PUCC protein n=1 Tax=Oceanibaculum indicum P24 TaxID=1207063 RepID=K2K030_9PROT|nr:BCD family MFS transporter [Oceanibaculum indicum]EKE76039.1 PUCC protein [Oceanibaculum indicum P24]
MRTSLFRQHPPGSAGLGWLDIVRLGLVQAALGAIVVLTNSTLNRVLIVELGLAAVIPGLLVGIHYAVQISRPVWGHRSDTGGSRQRWILGGLALLGLSGTMAAASPLAFAHSQALGLLVAIPAYVLIGVGIGASGTSLLALLATRTAPERRATAATITWMMMIAGIVVTSIITGFLLEPYSHLRLIVVTAATGAVAFAIACLAVRGVERRPALPEASQRPAAASFRDSLADVWQDRQARIFTLFVFLSMLAYSTQDLILEPFAGLMFGMTPGQSTRLSGTQHAGMLLGMAIVGISGWLYGRRNPAIARHFIVWGCAGSGLALAALALSASHAPVWPLQANIFLLGLMNGAFAVAAIGTMMQLAGQGSKKNAGMRMGVWGAAQAIAFGLGGLLGTIAFDLGRWATGLDSTAFALVFGGEAALFLLSTLLALRIGSSRRAAPEPESYIPGPIAAE